MVPARDEHAAEKGDRELAGRWAVAHDDGSSDGGGGDTDSGQGLVFIHDDSVSKWGRSHAGSMQMLLDHPEKDYYGTV